MPPSFGNEKSKIYSDSGNVSVPSSQILEPSRIFASARSLVGSSSTRPFINTMSADSSVAASLGRGSKVCEFVPSGTMPVIIADEPPAMFATMLVIGATVVAIFIALSLTTSPSEQPILCDDEPWSLPEQLAINIDRARTVLIFIIL